MDIAALMVSGLALIVSVFGTVLSNRRSKEALSESRAAAQSALWSTALEAVQRLATVNPWGQDLNEPFANMRVSLTALVDGLDWSEFDEWLAAEHQLGSALMRALHEDGEATSAPERRMELLRPFIQWNVVFSQNLRYARKTGSQADNYRSLKVEARTRLNSLYSDRGWGDPPTEIPGIAPLSPS